MTELEDTSVIVTRSSTSATSTALSADAAPCSKMTQALLRFEALDAQQQQQPSTLVFDELNCIRELTQLLSAAAIEATNATKPVVPRELRASAVAAVKTTCRRVMAHIARVASSANDDVAAFVRLDDDVTPAFELLAAFAELELAVATRRTRPPTDLETTDATADTSTTQRELRRWVPFAVLASAYVLCEQLPAANAMRAFAAAETVLGHCESLAAAPSQAALLAQFVAPVVALTSQQSGSMAAWVDQHSLPKHALCWVVVQIPFPHLGGDVLGRVLALVLPLVDDLRDATQRVGIAMLRHVVECVTPTELRWFADVLLDVLRRAITTREPATLDFALATLATALDKLSPPGHVAYYDAFVPRLLTDTSLTSDVAVRTLYVRHLRPIVERIGAPQSFQVIRYLQPLLKVLIANFESVSGPLLIETLATLRTVMTSAWPRVRAHTETIAVGVLRAAACCVVLDADAAVESVSVSDREQIVEDCVDVLALLQELSSSSTVAAAVADEQQQHVSVRGMLQRVATQSAALRPFCERTLAALEAMGSE